MLYEFSDFDLYTSFHKELACEVCNLISQESKVTISRTSALNLWAKTLSDGRMDWRDVGYYAKTHTDKLFKLQDALSVFSAGYAAENLDYEFLSSSLSKRIQETFDLEFQLDTCKELITKAASTAEHKLFQLQKNKLRFILLTGNRNSDKQSTTQGLIGPLDKKASKSLDKFLNWNICRQPINEQLYFDQYGGVFCPLPKGNTDIEDYLFNDYQIKLSLHSTDLKIEQIAPERIILNHSDYKEDIVLAALDSIWDIHVNTDEGSPPQPSSAIYYADDGDTHDIGLESISVVTSCIKLLEKFYSGIESAWYRIVKRFEPSPKDIERNNRKQIAPDNNDFDIAREFYGYDDDMDMSEDSFIDAMTPDHN